MRYVLQAVDTRAIELILAAAAGSEVLKRNLPGYRQFLEGARQSWAFDTESGNFMTNARHDVYDGTSRCHFHFFCNGQWYQIFLESMFSYRCGFSRTSIPRAQDRASVEQEIAAAFAVFGTIGNGPEGFELETEFIADDAAAT
jgi:hypothetical protein